MKLILSKEIKSEFPRVEQKYIGFRDLDTYNWKQKN